MLHIVMDSAGDLPPGWLDELNIHVIPINIHYGEEIYLDGVDLSDTEFYRIASQSNVIPTTSQPTPQQFIDFYKRIASAGETILSIHVTGKLSGTYQSAQIAARELVGKFQIIPFDSGSGSAAMGYMCWEARMLEQAGQSLDSILERLEFIRKNVRIVLTLNTLEYARKSGRVKALQAALASLLNLKPIIDLKDGILDVTDRVRTRRKSLDYLVNYLVRNFNQIPINLAIVHAQDEVSGNQLKEAVKEKLVCRNVITTTLSIGVAANLGPGTVGLIAYPVEERV